VNMAFIHYLFPASRMNKVLCEDDFIFNYKPYFISCIITFP